MAQSALSSPAFQQATQRLSDARRCLQRLKQVPGVRTEEDGPNGNPATLEEL